ncbi:MAG TPA: chemotaxis response regulator CheY [Desulfatiglandales bacterium]|nr:chemotaxis response regulator CheY [Desulfatiglandales bacterium]
MDLNMRVLVVDDFATMRRIIKNVLRQIGFTNITEADDGKTAISELKNEKYDLILSDWNMPGMSGLELLNEVRSDNELKNLPFVMITAEAKKEHIIEAVKAGVTSYVVKPFTAETVGEKLKKIFDN